LRLCLDESRDQVFVKKMTLNKVQNLYMFFLLTFD